MFVTGRSWNISLQHRNSETVMITQYGTSFARLRDHQSSRLNARSSVPYRQASDQSYRQLASLSTEHGHGTGCRVLNVMFLWNIYWWWLCDVYVDHAPRKKLRDLSPPANYTNERPPLEGEVCANFCGYRVSRGQQDGSLRPYSRLSKPDAPIMIIIINIII
jgi:hypothetical protein